MERSRVKQLLKTSRVEISPETFFLVSLRHEDWRKLLGDPALSPRMTAPFMILMDKYEVTLLLDETDFGTMRHVLRETKIAGGYRLLTFDLELALISWVLWPRCHGYLRMPMCRLWHFPHIPVTIF
jgi:hypothetical protein